jgi:hypothetical protein
MKVYISGKIGEEEISDATYRKFLDAVKLLTVEGHEPFNPCSIKWVKFLKERYAKELVLLKQPIISGQLPGFYAYCLINDMMELSLMDAICMLPDWESSPGAKAELAFAQAIGLKVFELNKNGIIEEFEKGKDCKATFWHPTSERPKDHSIILFYADGNECIGTYQSVNDTIYTDEAPDGGFYRWETDNIGEKWCYWDDVFEITNEGELKE